MTKTSRARYTLQFKQEAVRLVGQRPRHRSAGAHAGGGRPDAAELGQGPSPGKAHRSLSGKSVSAEQMEVSRGGPSWRA